MCLGIPGQIVGIADAANAIAIAEVGGVRRRISLACLLEDGARPESLLGGWVLIHVGFAMSRIDEAEAKATLEMLAALGEMEGEVEAMRASATGAMQ